MKWGFPNLNQKGILALLIKVPIDFGIDWSWSSFSFLTSNLLYSTKFRISYYLRRFVYI